MGGRVAVAGPFSRMAGDPLLTWGNFKLIGKGPLLGGASHCADLDQPNWMHKTCGGKSGVKYWRTQMELLPEMYIVEMEPTSYPRAPRIAATRARFAHFPGECLKPETRWRSKVNSNSRATSLTAS